MLVVSTGDGYEYGYWGEVMSRAAASMIRRRKRRRRTRHCCSRCEGLCPIMAFGSDFLDTSIVQLRDATYRNIPVTNHDFTPSPPDLNRALIHSSNR